MRTKNRSNKFRFMSAFMAMVMVLSILPAGIVPARAAGEETGGIVDAAVIFSDLHTSKSDYKESTLTGIMTAIKGANLPVSSVTSAGDAFSVNETNTTYVGQTSTLTGYIQSVLGNVPVNYVWSDHDRCAVEADGTTLLSNDSGMIYGAGADNVYGTADDDNYYIYSLSMADLSTNNRYNADFHTDAEVTAAISEFTKTVNGLKKDRPLFIASHQPLFDRRNDNGHAYEWCTAINEAATTMDIAFFFGHNHKYDEAGDYYYAKGSTMPVCKPDYSAENVELNFTHMCAGYMAPKSTGSTASTTREGVAVAITIYENAINYTTYNNTGVYTGSYALNETVKREFANNQSGSDDNTNGDSGDNVMIDEATGIKVEGAGLSNLTVETETDETVLAAVSTVLTNAVVYDIKVDGFASGSSAKVTMPNTHRVTDPAVFYISYDCETCTEMNSTVSGNTISFDALHFSVYAVGFRAASGEGEGDGITGVNWVEIEPPADGETTYTYTQADSISADDSYVIVDDNEAVALVDNGSMGSQPVEISGTTMTSTTKLTEWTFSKACSSTTAVSGTIFSDAGHYLRSRNNGSDRIYLNTSSGNMSYSDRGTTFRIYGNSRYLYYNGSSWGNSSYTATVRLYKFDKAVPTEGTPGIYVAIDGPETYTVALGTSEEKALAAVKADIIGYLYKADSIPFGAVSADDVEVLDKEKALSWSISPEYDGEEPGEYTVTIKYGDVEVGTVEVTVLAKPIKSATVSSYEGTVEKGAGSDADTGVKLTVTYDDENNTTEEIPVTVGMLRKNGVAVSTAEVDTLEGLTVVYADKRIENFTLNVIGKPGNNYPEYPNEGAVKVSKTAAGIDFQSSGIAQVEVSASGVPIKNGVDVILMLDTSSSMGQCTKCSNRHTTNYRCTAGGQTRAQMLEDSLADLLTLFRTSGPENTPLDVRVAIANFNGYYEDKNEPYYVDDLDEVGEDNGSQPPTSNPVQTSSTGQYSGHTAAAFVPVTDDSLDNFAQYTDGENLLLDYDSGTNYDYAFDGIYQLGHAITVANEANEVERDLYVIFMSDGIPFQWNYYTSNRDQANWNDWLLGSLTTEAQVKNITDCDTHSYYYDLNDWDNDGYRNEHRMANAVKGDPEKQYEVIRKNDSGLADGTLTAVSGKENLYTVPGLGAKLFAINFAAAKENSIELDTAIHAISSLASPDEKDVTYYHAANSADELKGVFKSIGTNIAYAANNARFVDQMGQNFNLQMEVATYQVVDDKGTTIQTKNLTPKIEILTYDIYVKGDDIPKGKNIGDRKGTSSVLETVTFNVDGTEAYSNLLSGNILIDGVICAQTFWYNTNSTAVTIDGVNIPTGTNPDGTTKGKSTLLPAETFYWKLGTVQTSELAMRYYVYLDGSMQGLKEAGSYATNEFAILYYDNYLGNPCQKETVSPNVAWKSANVSYAFYLVNDEGKIVVNQTTGATGSFANKVAVTNPVVYKEIKLNNIQNVESLNVAAIADGVLPKYYELYDTGAVYTVRINSGATGWWEIENSKSVQSTYVTGFSGDATAYSNATIDGLDENGELVATGHDYTHTTVWFAVVWKIQALPDVVVVDYGLPVDISVLANDMFGDGGKLVGIGPNSDALNLNGYDSELDGDFGATYNGTYGIARVNTATGTVSYTPKDMQMNGYDKFAYAVYYEAEEVDGEENKYYSGYYYDTVTVIPATTIYYEDNFVSLKSYTWDYGSNAWAQTENSRWSPAGNALNRVQDEDRPGKYSLMDANNIYGYDSVNLNKSTYSMGGAQKATVDYDNYAEATFEFYGTGFDVVSLTSNRTGTIVVNVYDESGALATYTAKDENGKSETKQCSFVVDTYYGYERVLREVTYTYTNGKWVRSVGEIVTDGAESPAEKPESPDEGATAEGNEFIWELSSDTNANCLYQVPVMKVESLTYGKYKAEIKAVYDPLFHHNQYGDKAETGYYDLYLDAIRIYDPANGGAADGNIDKTIEDAYLADGEAWPSYIELRNKLIGANSFGYDDPDTTTIEVEGMVFIDGNASVGDAQISEYISYGPNNEVYLKPNQSVAFMVSDILRPKADLDDNGEPTGETTLKSIIAQVHIGIKSANGKVGTYKISNIAETVDKNNNKVYTRFNEREFTVDTATDMYYNLTNWRKDIIVISNIGDSNAGIISLTNIKTTYTEDPTSNGTSGGAGSGSGNGNARVATLSLDEEPDSGEAYIYMTADAAQMTMRVLNVAVEEETDEPQMPETEKPGNKPVGTEKPGNQNPGNQESGNQKPSNQKPGNQNPGNQKPGNQKPGNPVKNENKKPNDKVWFF